MKITLTTYEIADILLEDEYAHWTSNGALALAEWLEEFEEETGMETELDTASIRGEWDEYSSALEAVAGHISIENILEVEALEYLRDNTLVIEFDGGVIIQAF